MATSYPDIGAVRRPPSPTAGVTESYADSGAVNREVDAGADSSVALAAMHEIEAGGIFGTEHAAGAGLHQIETGICC